MRLRIYSLFILVIFGAFGCQIQEETKTITSIATDTTVKGFSHRIHINEASLICTECHLTAETGDKPGMPTKSWCLECHEEKESQFQRYWKEKEVPFLQLTKLDQEKKPFPHQKHFDAEVKCRDCHGSVEKTDFVNLSFVPTMETCITCHRQKAPEKVSCTTCHSQINETSKPKSHSQNWILLHGQQAKKIHLKSQFNTRCDTCHQETGCNACHKTEKPKSHTEFWKQRGHGLLAGMNRSSCQTCHTPDTCNSCHHETAPRTHRPGWGGPRNEHCLNCHLPLNSKINNCGVCHQGTSSHFLAPVGPASMLPPETTNLNTINCLECHKTGVGNCPKLTHPVTNGMGSYCLQCHRIF